MRSPAVEWLYGLQHFGMKLGLDNIRALLEVLGRPDRTFPIAHVAGTNGKGSVAAMLDALLRAHGLRVGLFTSPHLIRPNERIRLDGADVDDARLDAALLEMREILERAVADRRMEAHPSFFEVTTATAVREFARIGVDVGVLEVGLGGRLDATNACDTDLSVVVTVDFDHMKSLGPTIEKIAFEKSGILRRGVPVVLGPIRPDAREVVVEIADERGAPVIDARAEATIEAVDDGTFAVTTSSRRYGGLRSALAGQHQRENARVAIVAAERLARIVGFEIDADAVRRGLAAVRWPGRLQWVEGRPRLLFDGAHNPAGIATLAEYLRERPIRPKPILLFGTTREKDLDRVLAPLVPHVDGLVAGRAGIDRAMDPDVLVEWARDRLPWVESETDPGAAIALARDRAGADGAVLVTGSLYLVGDVLTRLEARDAPGPVAL